MKHIFVVDDSPIMLKMAETALGNDYRLTTFTTGVQMLEQIANDPPDLMLLDLNMPDMDGFEVVKALNDTKNLHKFPIILLTAQSDPDTETKALDLGVADFIAKPFNSMIMLRRINMHIESLELRRNLETLVTQKTKIVDTLQTAVTMDNLTNVLNRRGFEEMVFEVLKGLDDNTPCALFMLDIDFFKRVNDTYGHQTGDLVLTKVAKTISDSLRTTDFVARYGGEEFCAFLSNASLRDSMIAAERIRRNIANLKFDTSANTFNVTISIGITKVRLNTDLKDLFSEADRCLYKAKETGRNKCVLYSLLNEEAD